MRVQQLGRPTGVEPTTGELRADPAEQREALQVVGPLAAGAVLIGAAGAAVEQRRVDHVDRHLAVRHLAEPQRDARSAEARADLGHGFLMQHRVGDRRQAGQQQAHVGALPDQCLRQRAQHIGQATGLDEGEDLRSDVQNLHDWSLSSISRVTSVMPFSDR